MSACWRSVACDEFVVISVRIGKRYFLSRNNRGIDYCICECSLLRRTRCISLSFSAVAMQVSRDRLVISIEESILREHVSCQGDVN